MRHYALHPFKPGTWSLCKITKACAQKQTSMTFATTSLVNMMSKIHTLHANLTIRSRTTRFCEVILRAYVDITREAGLDISSSLVTWLPWAKTDGANDGPWFSVVPLECALEPSRPASISLRSKTSNWLDLCTDSGHVRGNRVMLKARFWHSWTFENVVP